MEINSINLAGIWDFALDTERVGKNDKWFLKKLSDKFTLPGTTDSNKKGTGKEERNYKNLNRNNLFSGWAWYQKEVEIPQNFAEKHITLFLERCMWETSVWVDDTYIGSEESLCAPHIYNLSNSLTPGKHLITILVDNSNLKDENVAITDTKVYRDLTTSSSERWKHNCGGHHTMFLLPTNWNGIIGMIELRAESSLRLSKVDVYPQKDLKSIKVIAQIASDNSYCGDADLTYCLNDEYLNIMLSEKDKISLNGEDEKSVTFYIDVPSNMKKWDEFEPILYTLQVQLNSDNQSSTKSVNFGLRYIETQGEKILLNGNRVFLRGTIENCTFPLSFAPSTEKEEWDRIFRIAKSYGLNHMRFHTFCPPKAAFDAADRAGFFLQVEIGSSSCPTYIENPIDSKFLSDELKRILDTYGNHPSFTMVSMGNEQLIALNIPDVYKSHDKVLAEKVSFGQQYDPRHLYTATSHPYSPSREDDYFVSAWTMKCVDKKLKNEMSDEWDCFITGIAWGGPDPRTRSFYCAEEPTLAHDYDSGLSDITKPFVSHEVGQWGVFPNVNETHKYKGVLEAGNLELIKQNMKDNNMLHLAKDFVEASGKLSLMLYRDEIETAIKSEKLSGFQLLSICDYPGQGTSTVGILDAFWESKGLIAPDKYRQFCSSFVLLIDTEKRVYKSGDIININVKAANYQKEDLKTQYKWEILGNEVVLSSGCDDCVIKKGGVSNLGEINYTVPSLNNALKITVKLELKDADVQNSWDLWIYPDCEIVDNSCFISELDETTKNELLSGKNFILLPNETENEMSSTFTTAFWNPQMKKQTGTYGLMCNPQESVLKNFPNEGYTQWQWWDLLKDGKTMDLSTLNISPLVRVIDNFMTNRNLGLLFEAKVGKGKILVCSANLKQNSNDKPVVNWFKKCLLEYVNSNEFNPIESLDIKDLENFVKS